MDIPNGYLCQCYDGYTSVDCEVMIDNCDPNPCIFGECSNLLNDFNCTCEPGYTGKICGEGEHKLYKRGINLPDSHYRTKLR